MIFNKCEENEPASRLTNNGFATIQPHYYSESYLPYNSITFNSILYNTCFLSIVQLSLLLFLLSCLFLSQFFFVCLESSRTGWSPGCSLNTHLNPWTHTLIRKGMGSFSIIDHHAAWPCACICVSAWRGPHSGYVWGHAMEDNNRWSGNGGTPGNSSGHGREQPQECANKTNTFRNMNARTRASTYSYSLVVGFQPEPFIIWLFYILWCKFIFPPKG